MYSVKFVFCLDSKYREKKPEDSIFSDNVKALEPHGTSP